MTKAKPRSLAAEWRVPIILMAATFLSTFYVGALQELHRTPGSVDDFAAGWVFAVPLMAILMAHEFGHYIAGKLHGVDISPPYFIPLPVFLGTMGAVIQMRETVKSRNALLDIGAAGPLAGLFVAIPVLAYGIATSEVGPPPEEGFYYLEGRSILYVGMLTAIKGPIPPGHDILLNSTAFAGWAGLLVTMINLVPFAQLDGGHIAYALFGPKQNRYSAWVLRILPIIAVVVCAGYGLNSYADGVRGERLVSDFMAGVHWLTWAVILFLLTRVAGSGHPPTEDDSLSPGRRVVAVLTLAIFVLLFMPFWLRVQ